MYIGYILKVGTVYIVAARTLRNVLLKYLSR